MAVVGNHTNLPTGEQQGPRTGVAREVRSSGANPPVAVHDNMHPDDFDSSGVEPALIRDLLGATALFAGVTSIELAELSSVCRTRRFAAGELILREGAPD